jgi:uncharacterized membrane protein
MTEATRETTVTEANREAAVQARRNELTAQIAKYQRRRVVAATLAVLISAASVLFSFWFRDAVSLEANRQQNPRSSAIYQLEFSAVGILFYGGLALVFVANYSVRLKQLRNDLKDIDNQLDLIQIPEQSHEKKAQKLLQIQQFELKRSYDQTLRQSTGIFWVGVGAMLLGFVVIAWSLYFVGSHSTDNDAKWSGEIW